jgi:hypothetical protein
VGTGGRLTRGGRVVSSCLNDWLNVNWRGETVLNFQEGLAALHYHDTSLADWTLGIGDLGSAVCLPGCTQVMVASVEARAQVRSALGSWRPKQHFGPLHLHASSPKLLESGQIGDQEHVLLQQPGASAPQSIVSGSPGGYVAPFLPL